MKDHCFLTVSLGGEQNATSAEPSTRNPHSQAIMHVTNVLAVGPTPASGLSKFLRYAAIYITARFMIAPPAHITSPHSFYAYDLHLPRKYKVNDRLSPGTSCNFECCMKNCTGFVAVCTAADVVGDIERAVDGCT